MSQRDKFRSKLMGGRSDSNIEFEELVNFLNYIGFTERIAGSHHVMSREGVVEILSLQPKSDGKTKPYQVKQVRTIINQYGL